MGIASLGLNAIAPCTGGLAYPVAFALGVTVFIKTRPQLQSATGAEATLVRSAFYAGTLGAALAAWLPFMAVGGWAFYTWAIAAGVLT